MRNFSSPRIVQVIVLGSTLILTGTPVCPQMEGEETGQEDIQQEVNIFITTVNGMALKVQEFFAMLKKMEEKRKELAEQNQENVRKSQEKAREVAEKSKRLQEETRVKLEEARMRQKEQLRMLQDRMRR